MQYGTVTISLYLLVFVIGAIFSVFVALLTRYERANMHRIEALERLIEKMAIKLTEMEKDLLKAYLELARGYVTKEDHRRSLERLYEQLLKMDEKLDDIRASR